ncbi:MAG: hypothetical protein JWM86_454 [Thermoleophilia bacterium]|nr:hypothetical protein [Thermoleophilia bacterium]
MRALAGAVVACAACMAIATAASPAAGAPSDDRAASRAWSPFFAQDRPVVAVDARRVIIQFDDPSLGDWLGASERTLTPAQQRAWTAKARLLQQKRLDALVGAGVQFRVEQRYLRVLNGVSITVHGDGAQLLRDVAGVQSVTPVRTVWPAAIDDAGAAGAAAAAGGGSAKVAAPADAGVRVAVLDTAIDSTHPAVAGRLAPAFDATTSNATEPAAKAPALDGRGDRRAVAVAPAPDAHGTAVAGAVLRGAGSSADDVQVLPVRVLATRPARDGVESVTGDSDDLLAGLEHAVDPNGNGDAADAVDVAVIASTTPYTGFAGSPEDHAADAAAALGTMLVAASGNDGASGDDVGTVGSFAAAAGSLAVGAADLRGRTPAVDVRVHGSGIDQTFEQSPLLTSPTNAALPTGDLAVVVVDGRGDQVVDYLDAELRSRVGGSVALVAAREGITVATQARAAADAGAIALLVGTGEAATAAAGTIDVPGVDIPVIALDLSDARALRGALADGTRLVIGLDGSMQQNPTFGSVAGFSSAGPRLDGVGRPDALAPGVGMVVAGSTGSWRIASGTSIAAAWAAGQAAAVRAAHPEWDAATTRAALLGSARALGTDRKRPAVALQGAGVLDSDRATAAGWIAGTGRIDFGTIAAGSGAKLPLDLTAITGAARAAGAELDIRLDDGGSDAGVTPSLAGTQLVLDVADDARAGHVGGWLVLPEHGIRIPWTATIRDAARATVPVHVQLSRRVLAKAEGAGAFGGTLTVAIGGSGADGALGLAAVQRLDVRLVDASGKDHGSIGGLDQALPGVYTFGIAGIDPKGKALGSGAWQLRVRYVPAADPDGTWRTGPVATIVVPKAPRPAR